MADMLAALVLAAGCALPPPLPVTGEFHYLGAGVQARVARAEPLDFAAVTRAPACDEFQPLTGQPNFGALAGSVWLRFAPVFPDQAGASWRLVVRFVGLETVCVHWPVPGGTAEQCLRRGDPAQREHWATGRLVFTPPLDLLDGQLVHVYADSRMWLKVPLELATVDYLVRHESRRELGWGMYYGLLLMIVIVSLALYFGRRDLAFLYFALQTGAQTLALAAWQGRFAAFDTADVSLTRLGPAISGLFMAAGTRFYQQFMETRRFTPRAHWLLEACFWVGLVVGVLTLVVPAPATRAMGLVFLAWLAAVFACALLRVRDRYWPAAWILAAGSAMLFALFLNALAAAGVLLLEARFSLRTLYAANLLSAGFLVFGLVSRVRLLSAERDRANEVATANRNLALYRAHFDELTGLRNRSKFREDLQERIAQSAQAPRRLAIVTASPERFRELGQALGLDAGDAALFELAERLRRVTRPGELVGRLGPATFALALELEPGEGRAGLDARCALLRKALGTPLMSGRGATLGMTLGAALYPDHGAAAEQLLRSSEIAHDHAQAGAVVQLFEPAFYQHAEHYLKLNQDLRHALAREQLELHYQPLCMLQDRRPVAAEALLRWNRAGEYLPPEQFIPIAEGSQLIEPLTDWVFRQACRQARQWRTRGMAVPVCVNVSAPQFRLPNFVERIDAALREADVPPELLAVEITESLLMDDLPATRATLVQLRERGIDVAVDDFGVGYSSLAYLRTLPVRSIKIDRSFLAGIPHEAESVAVINAIIALGKDLLLNVIAEGIETEAQREFLLARGVTVGQGFLLAQPMPAPAFEDWLRQRAAGAVAA
jgi:diguanylate cyclase (GGDEF)-like protein